jgi:hypothetical protein
MQPQSTMGAAEDFMIQSPDECGRQLIGAARPAANGSRDLETVADRPRCGGELGVPRVTDVRGRPCAAEQNIAMPALLDWRGCSFYQPAEGQSR